MALRPHVLQDDATLASAHVTSQSLLSPNMMWKVSWRFRFCHAEKDMRKQTAQRSLPPRCCAS